MKKLNVYSKVILDSSIVLMIFGLIAIVLSGIIIHNKHYFAAPFLFLLGFALLSLGVLIIVKGLRTVTPSPQKVWIITWFGDKTNTVVKKWPVLLLDWPIDIVGHVELELAQVDHDFEMKKKIICMDQIYIVGKISVSMIANDESGEALRNFDDIGRMDGVIKQLDDILTGWVQYVANKKDSEWMERHSFQLGAVLLKAVLGTHGANPPPDPEDRSLDYLFEEVGNTTDSEFDPKNNSLDDARGFGIKIKKFQPIFEAPEEIQNARNKKGVEHAQRTEELQETETIHQQIEARYKLYDGKKTKEECREEIIAERLMKQGRYQKIENRGGVSLANVDTNQGGSK